MMSQNQLSHQEGCIKLESEKAKHPDSMKAKLVGTPRIIAM